MLYIITVCHDAQECPAKPGVSEAQSDLVRCLRRVIEEVKPVFIGEEHSCDALNSLGKTSIVKALAHEKKIEHRFCEPTSDERSERGIKDAGTVKCQAALQWAPRDMSDEEAEAVTIACFFPLREAHWLKKLDGCRDQNAIFVCGDLHIECGSFTGLLEKERIPYKLVERGIGMSKELIASQSRPVRYLMEHPELRDCKGVE